MVAAFDGWNDACQSAMNVVRHLVSKYRSLEVGHISRDGFYDFQAARPMQCTIQGTRHILWPQTAFYDITISPDVHILAQLGPEPNYHWMEYCQESLHFAKQYDVDELVTLGSMFAETPHSRPLPLDMSRDGKAWDTDSEYSGPIGIPHVLDAMAVDEGYRTDAIWVSVPQYLGSDPCPQATVDLLAALSKVVGVDLSPMELAGKAAQWHARGDVMVRNNADMAQYVEQLEHDYDMKESARKIASQGTPEVEQLVQEAEAYLRELP
ncbi:PAC2 family protein [Bifidobacterium cuniculi]|uniref:Cytosolic protein n=1 Tax=Bifidobacterium cuniculi TaxID=1688 RepID=A0A087B4R5_9BIFI|nr:PAC2 family protein [Bifidobacterium cuniculi]KFI66015.1 cytosolic protein [Bifidobacterium cuniculi]